MHFPIQVVHSPQMMSPVGKGSPAELGRALEQAREKAGVSLEELAARTKISRRMWEGLEAGDFARLPGEAFARMFLRQYLEAIGEPAEPWLRAFATAWKRFEDERSHTAVPALPVVAVTRGGRIWAWVVGVLVVVAALASVVLFDRHVAHQQPAVIPSPTAVLALVTPLPAPTPAAAAEGDGVEPPVCTLVLATRDWPCWVEVRYGQGQRESRLLAAGARWELPEVTGVVDLVVGDAAALEVCFRGTTLPALGKRGEVVRLRLNPEDYGQTETGR